MQGIKLDFFKFTTELRFDNIPLHCLGFLAQLGDDILYKREVSVDDSPSSVSSNLDEWKKDEDEELCSSL